jgi:hypothetical protein
VEIETPEAMRASKDVEWLVRFMFNVRRSGVFPVQIGLTICAQEPATGLYTHAPSLPLFSTITPVISCYLLLPSPVHGD